MGDPTTTLDRGTSNRHNGGRGTGPAAGGTLAGILAPWVMGGVIQRASGILVGFMTGFTINAVILIVSGLLGLLLLWPDTERARLMGEVPQPKFA